MHRARLVVDQVQRGTTRTADDASRRGRIITFRQTDVTDMQNATGVDQQGAGTLRW